MDKAWVVIETNKDGNREDVFVYTEREDAYTAENSLWFQYNDRGYTYEVIEVPFNEGNWSRRD